MIEPAQIGMESQNRNEFDKNAPLYSGVGTKSNPFGRHGPTIKSFVTLMLSGFIMNH